MGLIKTSTGVTLCKFEQLTPLLGLYLDHRNGWQLHTGAERGGFRGYAVEKAARWMVMAWCPASGFQTAIVGHDTEASALRSLRRHALRIEG